MLKTVKVTGFAYKQDGTPAAGAQGSARLSMPEIDNGIVVPMIYTFCVEDDGHFEFEVWPNERGATGSYYSVKIHSKSDTLFDSRIVVPDVDHDVDIEDIINQDPYPQINKLQQALLGAQKAANEAKDSEDKAKISEDNAKTSETLAKQSEVRAKESEDNAKDSEDSASANAQTATTKANESAHSATKAAQSATKAATSETTALLSATAASRSATQAQNSAQEAATSASGSELSAGASATSAQESKLSSEASEDSAELSKNWAIEMSGLVEGEDYSSKYYANQSKDYSDASKASADSSETSAVNAKTSEYSTLYPDDIYPLIDLRFAGADRFHNSDVSFSRASKATYWDKYGVLREADIDEPRFAYDPVTGEAMGLLLEPFTSTNLLLNSEVVADQTVIVPSGDITLSFYGEGEISFTGAATGTLQGAGSNDRAVITVTSEAGELVLSVTDGSPTLGQLEEGTAATSYIPTEGSQVTRASDFFTLTVGDWYKPDRGTLVVTSATPDGELVTKLGEFEGYSNSNEVRKYRATYSTTINATKIELGVGTFKSLQYYNRVMSKGTTTTV